jgi:hypothetical protein
MKRVYLRWGWQEGEAARWRCANCGRTAEQAVNVSADGVERPYPYNLNQVTCSEKCALERKSQRQRERRAKKRAAAAPRRR